MIEPSTVDDSTTEHIRDDDPDKWIEEDENYDDEYEDGEAEAGAEEIARRLNEQLWANINKAHADRANATATTSALGNTSLQDGVPPGEVPSSAHTPPSSSSTSSKKEEAALKTMSNVLKIAGNDPLVRSILASAAVPGAGNINVLEILYRTVAAGTISKDLAKSLSLTLISLARSDALFSVLRHSNAPALQLDKGKRKLDETEEERQKDELRAFKRPAFAHGDLQSQIADAVRVVSETLYQRVHAVHRPYRCTACPASFARNHDLKRHTKLHDKTGYQCTGCHKLFSRRDAIKRHKNSSAARGGKGEACVDATIKEVELEKEGDEEALQEGRRTTGGQATWASVIARAQQQNMPSSQNLELDNSVINAVNSSTVESLGYGSDRVAPTAEGANVSAPPLSLYGLSEEQAQLLEQAIANAASAALAQAEAEAALEEEEEEYEEDELDDGDMNEATPGS